MNNFHYGQVLLKMLYEIELDSETYEELALIAWNYIGNKNVRLFKCSLQIDSDNSVTLPCNALEEDSILEAVTTSFEDWNRSTNIDYNGDIMSSIVENNIEYQKHYNNPLYIPGKLLKYEKIGNKLYFQHNYGVVNILYKGVLFDEEGLPEISDKEATAIATYVAYVTKLKEGLSKNNPQILQLAAGLNGIWLKQCDQARVQYLNQNQMNTILDAKSNWNRKIFGKSYKGVG